MLPARQRDGRRDVIYDRDNEDAKLGRILRYDAGPHKGDWHWTAADLAASWCREHGLIVGPTQRDAPRGIMEADRCDSVAKWRNLTEHERRACDGVLLRPRGCDGPAEVWMRETWEPKS